MCTFLCEYTQVESLRGRTALWRRRKREARELTTGSRDSRNSQCASRQHTGESYLNRRSHGSKTFKIQHRGFLYDSLTRPHSDKIQGRDNSAACIKYPFAYIDVNVYTIIDHDWHGHDKGDACRLHEIDQQLYIYISHVCLHKHGKKSSRGISWKRKSHKAW
jgi:hypothetical protein